MLAIEWVNAVVHSKWFELFLIVFVATFHGYGAAWLAVRMLFRPTTPSSFSDSPSGRRA